MEGGPLQIAIDGASIGDRWLNSQSAARTPQSVQFSRLTRGLWAGRGLGV